MKPFRAYMVSSDDRSVICYAQHAIVARRDGANEINEDFSYVTCRRQPQFDALYPHGPSYEQLFQDGWRFECSLCGSYTDCDSGMYSDGSFYCETCVEDFTRMKPISTPTGVSSFFGSDWTIDDKGNWVEEPIPTSALPIPSTRYNTPYVWFSAFR